MLVASPKRSLASFHSDAEARTCDFFEAYANELPADMGARFQAYGDKFIRRHARVQLKSLFKLMRGQCNRVIIDVNTELQDEEGVGEEDGIRESIEEAATTNALPAQGAKLAPRTCAWHRDRRRCLAARGTCPVVGMGEQLLPVSLRATSA